MSRQRELLPRLIELVLSIEPECGIVLIGSVSSGYERPESDVDLFVVTRGSERLPIPDSKVLHEEEGMTLVESQVDGLIVHFACWPAYALARSLAATPHVFYPFSQGEILIDPAGLAHKHQDIAREYFKGNPRIAKLWAKQLGELRRHKLDPSHKLEFPEWGDFARHLEAVLGG